MGSNLRPHMEVAKLAIFNREVGKVGRFITACRLFLRMKLRGVTVEKQVQWVLSYMQRGFTDVWKKNVMEKLESGEVEYESVEEFLMSLKKEFSRGKEESIKAVELRKLEQGEKQWYKRATALDRNWRESKREEERLRGKKEMTGGAPKQEQR